MPVAEADQLQRFLRLHRIARDLGDERDVLARRQARDEIVELEDEADVLAAVTGQRGVVDGGQIVVAVDARRRRSARRARREC